MDQEGWRCPRPSRDFTTRGYDADTVATSTGYEENARCEATGRLPETEACSHNQDHPLQRSERTQICQGHACRGDGSDSGDARERILEDRQFQAVQLQSIRRVAECWLTTSSEQSQGGVPEDLLLSRLHRDEHRQAGRPRDEEYVHIH